MSKNKSQLNKQRLKQKINFSLGDNEKDYIKKMDVTPFKRGELVIYEGKYETYEILLPAAMASLGCTKYNLPWASSAIKIIPLLSTPRILRGAKFATTTTCLPIMSAGSKCIAIPDKMVLFSNPKSTSNCNNLSAFSTFFASMMVPTRKSIFPKSSKTISGLNALSFASGAALASVVQKPVPCQRMNLIEAELVKIAINNFVTMKISYANSLYQAAEKIKGINI